MLIEGGEFYKDELGKRVGPMLKYGSRFFHVLDMDTDHTSYLWEADGKGCGNLDLIAPWPTEISHAQDDVNMPTAAALEEQIKASTAAAMKDASSRMAGRIKQHYAETAPAPARSIYLSGPMKGYPGSNYSLFNAVAEQLRRAGHRVYNPAEFGSDKPFDGFPIRQAFAAYSKFICEEADAIVLLPGWEASKGANAERALADNCGIEIIPFDCLSTTITTEGTF